MTFAMEPTGMDTLCAKPDGLSRGHELKTSPLIHSIHFTSLELTQSIVRSAHWFQTYERERETNRERSV
jgi:hypothetical protein